MVIKGRSRSNGAQLADYLLQSKENDLARIIDIRGTAQPDSLKRSLLEMSLSSELTKRGNKGIYHAQVNPAIGEDRPMTHDDWLKAADLLEQSLGLDGQKRAIVLHEKNGRVHGHIVWERYDHDTGKLRSDSHNFKKHDQARAQIEQELGHNRTPQKAGRELTDKERLTDLWQQYPDGRSFIEAAEAAGYYIAQKDDRRPFRAITPEGASVDLVRQLDGIKTKEVRDRLQPIRADLRQEAEALELVKAERQRAPEIELMPEPDKQAAPATSGRDVSDSQELAVAMISRFKQQRELPQLRPGPQPVMSYSFTVQQASTPVQELEIPSEPQPDVSDSQVKAAAMLEQYRKHQAERLAKVQESQQKAAENQADITDPAAKMLAEYRRKQEERKRQHDRGLDFH